MQELLRNLVADEAQTSLLKDFEPGSTPVDPAVTALIDERLASLGLNVSELREKQPKLYEMIQLIFPVNAQRIVNSQNPNELYQRSVNELEEISREQQNYREASQKFYATRNQVSICRFIHERQKQDSQRQRFQLVDEQERDQQYSPRVREQILQQLKMMEEGNQEAAGQYNMEALRLQGEEDMQALQK